MMDRPEHEVLASVVQKIDRRNKLLGAWPLTGGVSAQVLTLDIEQPDGARQTLVLRRHGEIDLSGNPDIAATEFRLLQLLQSAGVAVPVPIYLDRSCEVLPTPYLIIEYIEGEIGTEAADQFALAAQMAEQLIKVHEVGRSKPDLDFLPRTVMGIGDPHENLDESLKEGSIREALVAIGMPEQVNTRTLLHGDFWPGNVLWRDGHIAAIIDWENAQVGDPLADVANSHFELYWFVGPDAALCFLRRYRELAKIDFVDLAYWELRAALRPASKLDTWGLAEDKVQAMRVAHQNFVEETLTRL